MAHPPSYYAAAVICMIAAVSCSTYMKGYIGKNRENVNADGHVNMRVLVTGGNGYLAQHLLVSLLEDTVVESISYTVRDRLKMLPAGGAHNTTRLRGHVVTDLVSDVDGLTAAIQESRPTVVVHTAALSSPRACEANVDAATATNAPRLLLRLLREQGYGNALIIYTSTDQVYNGDVHDDTRPYKETDVLPKPRNSYGASKFAFEELLASEWGRYVVLRCSNILGEPSPLDGTGKFLQWVLNTALEETSDNSYDVSSKGVARTTVSLFDDEFRSFVDVADVVRIIRAAMHHKSASIRMQLNCGGPEGMSRYALGQRVAQQLAAMRGIDTVQIMPVHASTVDMGYASPPDLSMDSTTIESVLGVSAPGRIDEAIRRACEHALATNPQAK